ncbi:YqgQ family protein [Fictibacillus iocasae]|uniref:YqgQ family protein n=1 Tax=Fictibacillus iocasae TaxID=2715437 RepID=A0ABW2NM86_9BACL
MKTFYDVQQLLKRFGSFIYTGHRLGDIELMMDEVRQLYTDNLIQADEFQKAVLILRAEQNKFQ